MYECKYSTQLSSPDFLFPRSSGPLRLIERRVTRDPSLAYVVTVVSCVPYLAAACDTVDRS
jgi:hypothetical protein